MADAGRRVFLALWPDPAVADALWALSGLAHPYCGGRRMRRETLHLTVDFIGDVAESALPALIAALAAVRGESFALRIDTLGHWAHNRIVWAGCSAPPPALTSLVASARAVLAGLGRAEAARPAFFPHVTLIRKGHCAGPVPAVVAPIDWPVAEWVLMESCRAAGGVSYRRLAGWPLA